MTTSDGAPDALDRAIDEALDGLTRVDGIEGQSRARVHARLAQGSLTDALTDARAIDIGIDRVGRRRWRPWLLAPAVAAALVLALVVVWLSTTPSVRELAHRRPQPPVEAPVARIEPKSTPVTASGRATELVTETTRAHVRRTPRPPLAAARLHATGSPRREPDQLDAYIRALTALPSDVWERVDAAGPPSVNALSIDEGTAVAPLAVEHLSGTEWPTDGPTDFNPPGGSR